MAHFRRLYAPVACLLAVSLLFHGPVRANELTIHANTSDPAPRAAWEAVVAQFSKDHPDIAVKFNVFDHESYKRSIRNWLTSASPDVVFWFAGNRMRQFARLGLFQDVSELFTTKAGDQFERHAVELVTHESRQYGVPYAFYHIGFFYRPDLLRRAGVHSEPRNWNELLLACRELRQTGVAAFAIGTKDLWPAAAWFDYLNLRINGLEFHRALVEGRTRFTDERLLPVFTAWRELLDADCFTRNHSAMNWQESQALIFSGRAAMILMGSFIVAQFPADMREKMAFFPFPEVKPGVPRFEEAPMNSLHIPARAKNPANAKRFLAFTMQPAIQQSLAASLIQIPVNREAGIVDNPFLAQGRSLIASAQGLSQFFDRDMDEELASLAMKGFQEFMLQPDRLDQILKRLEQARARIVRD